MKLSFINELCLLVLDLSKKVYKVKQKTVVLHALPLAWNLVKSMSTTGASGPLKDAVSDFISELHKLMGDSLFEHAASAPMSNAQLVEKVKEIAATARKTS